MLEISRAYQERPKRLMAFFNAQEVLLAGIASSAYHYLTGNLEPVRKLEFGGLGALVRDSEHYLRFNRSQLHFARLTGCALQYSENSGNALQYSENSGNALQHTINEGKALWWSTNTGTSLQHSTNTERALAFSTNSEYALCYSAVTPTTMSGAENSGAFGASLRWDLLLGDDEYYYKHKQ